ATAASGRCRVHSATREAASAGSVKSRVSRPSGARASRVLGFSEAQTRSTPSVCAASTKSSVRYVRVGRSKRRRACPPGVLTASRSGFAGGVVGVRPLRGGGCVEHLDDLGNLFLDEALEFGLECDVFSAAPPVDAAP